MVIKTASPGVIVNEVDLTRGTSDAITSNVACLAGPFQKGPVDKITLVQTEVEFQDIFGDPTDENYEYWFSVDNFLEYGGTCYVVRSDDEPGGNQQMRNAADGVKFDANGNEIKYYVKNEDDFEENYFNLDASMGGLPAKFIAANPGTWGNNLSIAVIDRGADYEMTMYDDKAYDLAGGELTGPIYFNKNVELGSDVGTYVRVAAAEEQVVVSDFWNAADALLTSNFDIATGGIIGGITAGAGGSGYGPTSQLSVPKATELNNVADTGQDLIVGVDIVEGKLTRVVGSPATAGTGYAAGQIVQVSGGAMSNGTIEILTVGASGEVLTLNTTPVTTGLGYTGTGDATDVESTVLDGSLDAVDGARVSYDVTGGVVSNIAITQLGDLADGATYTILGGGLDATFTLNATYDMEGATVVHGSRVILNGQTDATENGIYDANSLGAWTRSPDANNGTEFTTGKELYVDSGDNAGLYNYNGTDTPTLGTDDITFAAGAGYEKINNGDFVAFYDANFAVQANGFIVKKDTNGTYKVMVTSGTPGEGQTIAKIGSSQATGAITDVDPIGRHVLYSFGATDAAGDIIDERIVNTIFVPNVLTYEQGLERGWPLALTGKQKQPIDGDRAKTDMGDLYVWQKSLGGWVLEYNPEEGDLLTDGNAVFITDDGDDWYNKQVAFAGIPWFRFASRPGTSPRSNDQGARNDELHVIVYDRTGDLTGSKGNVIESFYFASKLRGAKTPEGDNNYYVDVINRKSSTIFANRDVDTTKLTKINEDFDFDAPGTSVGDGVVSSLIDAMSYDLGDGVDQLQASLGELMVSYQKYLDENVEDLDYILQGPSLSNEDDAVSKANFIISMAEELKTCMAFITPPRYAALDPLKADIITERVVEFYDQLSSSSYASFDSGYKYTYDRFNDKNRYVPMNPDVAGLLTESSIGFEPWYSPAGVVRGQIRNVTRLSYNPSKEQRDVLYSNRINPISTFPGEGTILYGDKTALSYSSAFDRINVRRLFLILEKEISKISRSVLFEFNDVTTRSLFKNNVNPYLRDVQSRRGMTDFLVVCDESNNTPEIIDRNEFVADIYIKPSRSINFVTLNFVATKTGVTFSEAVGLFRR
jgi:hypothetical protein